MNVALPFNAATAAKAGGKHFHSEFAVSGMRCAGCISKLERGLGAVPGVAGARVNFTAGRVAVDHDPALTEEALCTAISKIGFSAQPLTADQDLSQQQTETRRLLRAMAVAGFAMMNVMLLSVSVWSGAGGATRDLFHWLSAMIAMPAIAYAGRPFFESAWKALRHGRTNMDVPISIGVCLVTGLSLFETIVGSRHVYFDGATMLLFFLLVGRFLDSAMRDRARNAATLLLKRTAPGAMVVEEDGSSRWAKAAELAPGMRMLAAAGDRLAADGVVEQGISGLDLSLLTGESTPEPVRPGSKVLAGTLNLDAPLTVRITAAGADTSIADIARMMENAGQTRSAYVRIADRAARLYAPAVHSLAALSFIGWVLAGAGWHQALLISAAVLIITCPCALGLAVPAAHVVVAGALFRKGVIVKEGAALERLAEADVALFDKTGTLTLGRPTLVGALPFTPAEASAALALARASRHPLARALATTLETEGVAASPVKALSDTPGLGVEGTIGGRRARLGRPDWVGVASGDADMLVTAFSLEGQTPHLLRFSDPLRPDALRSIERLRTLGLESGIISGDRAEAVRPVAGTLGLTGQVRMTPADKLAAIERLRETGKKVLVVGDGLNDGPALAAGHVSMAPASASDVGQTAADFVFLGDSLMPVPLAIGAARRTMAIVRQNFGLAIGYNVLAVPLAIAGVVTPLIAALAMSASSLIVVGNALRLRGAAR